MSKRGVGFITFETVELVFLISIIIFFGALIYQDSDEHALNQIKAQDISLGVSSVYLIDGDLSVDYEFGEELYNVRSNGNYISVFKTNKEKEGISKFSRSEGFEFADNVQGKNNKILIEKKKKAVIVS
ncbi:hypothetical protein HYV89_03205 [Candidatus Woesearchaeota archaeon]|nr:hypothetical protein [Candidatus Woesearchaeota archaeon]